MHDVIVVGARCAGAATAIRFARSGQAVLVLDKGRRGSDTLSTHVLVTGALRQLERLGLLDAVLKTGAPPVHTFLAEFDGQSHPEPIEEPPGYLLSVRRTVLDPLLVDAATEAGATFEFGVRVDDLIEEDGRVVGVRGTRAGEPFEARARLVVGADGRRSVVARKAGAREYNAVPSLGVALYAYFRRVGPTVAGADVLQFASGPGCDVLCCPCDGDLHIALLMVNPEEYRRIDSDKAYEARLRTVPAFAPRLEQAVRASRIFRAPAPEIRGYFREPYGLGWALVGDAGYYAHPAAANGIRDALRSAELLHERVEQAWKEGLAAETYLNHYQSVRDAENLEPFYESYRQGSINPFSGT